MTATTVDELERLLILIVNERIGFGPTSRRDLFDDALQEARIRAWERLEQGHSAQLATYAARQAVIDVLRGFRMTGSKAAGKAVTRTAPLVRQGSEGDEYVIEPQDVAAVDAIELIEARETLRPALDALPERQRRVVTSIYYDGLTQAEVAEQFGVTRQAVSLWLQKALGAMRSELSAA